MSKKEFILWGLPKGSIDRLDERILFTLAKTPAQMDAAKTRASLDGWHSFRVQILDLQEVPRFSAALLHLPHDPRR